jgi:hypothetical protein
MVVDGRGSPAGLALPKGHAAPPMIEGRPRKVPYFAREDERGQPEPSTDPAAEAQAAREAAGR